MTALVTDVARRVAIRPWEARDLDALRDVSGHDVLLASVGYEPRSFAISSALGPRCRRCVAVEFPDQRTASYKRSLGDFRAAGFEVRQDWNGAFLPFVKALLHELSSCGREARLAVDVSSMNRVRIAAVVQALAEVTPRGAVAVEFLYAPAVFDPPQALPEGVITLAPVSAYFSGDLQPGSTPVALVGVGYEPNKAAGALSNLEIPGGAAYIPTGPDERFRAAVLDANRGLLEGSEPPEQIDYEVLDPFDCIDALDGAARALLQGDAAPVLIPLGPKIFALSSCITAALHHPRVQVWRASFNAGEHAIEREADKWVCGIEVEVAAAKTTAAG